MVKNSIITNPVNVHIQIATAGAGFWEVKPSLTAFPGPTQPHSKNIIFLLDNSLSMFREGRLLKVQAAVICLLDRLGPNDTFSVVGFNDTATPLVVHQSVSKQEISDAKKVINKISANGCTSFAAAFTAINTPEMIPLEDHTSIIFLTDGEDDTCTAEALLAPFLNRTFLRVIPIGILERQDKLLNKLASLSGGGRSALYINDRNPTDYQRAFDSAFKRAMEHAQSPTQLDMTIRVRNTTNVTEFEVKRTLNPVCYDGDTATTTTLYFNSPMPPRYLKFRFHSEDMLLQASYSLTSEERDKLKQGQRLNLAIPAFKWKNNSTCSWILALGSVAIGLLLLAGAVFFVLASPQLSISLLMWQTLAMIAIAGLVGLSLLVSGMVAVARKFYLPTKSSADAEAKENNGSGSLRLEKDEQQPIFRPSLGFFSCGVLAAGGAVSGYFGGTAAAAISVVIATGISPSLFIAGCAVGGAIALPLLVYGCVQLCEQPMAQTSLSMA